MKKQIYLRNVARRWTSELKTSNKAYILSPYITSKTADSVLKGVRNCEIYTLFKIENFLSGASSIRTLRNLLRQDCKIYAIPRLHAKIVLISDTFLSIGSQNLTNLGTQNREATFVSTSPSVIKFVENEINEKWLIDKKVISLEMLEELEEKIRPLKGKFNKLKLEFDGAEELIFKREEERETKRQKAKEHLRIALSNIKKAQKVFSGQVQVSSNYNHWIFSTTAPKPDLLHWLIEDKSFSLSFNHERYLALVEDTGKLAWARVNKTCITFFENSVRHSQQIDIDGISYQITFQANWDEQTLSAYNLLIILDGIGNDAFGCEIQSLFTVKELKIVKISPIGNALLSNNLQKWIKKNRIIFDKIVIDKLLKSFKYKRNLTGSDADIFFEQWGRYYLRLGEVDNDPFLLFKKM